MKYGKGSSKENYKKRMAGYDPKAKLKAKKKPVKRGGMPKRGKR